MRVTFDSNAWEAAFDLSEGRYLPIRQNAQQGRLKGYICEIGFRIEAIRKIDRKNYFGQPKFEVTFGDFQPSADGKYVRFMSMGPKDESHPGLPEKQAAKLRSALNLGVKLLRARAWMGLPAPAELRDPMVFVSENESIPDREGTQILVADRIDKRGVGKKPFDEIGGWNLRPDSDVEERKFYRACAEWADGETVAAHIAYHNDILCTNDLGRSSGKSIFNSANRDWLSLEYGVKFMTLEQLLEVLALDTAQ